MLVKFRPQSLSSQYDASTGAQGEYFPVDSARTPSQSKQATSTGVSKSLSGISHTVPLVLNPTKSHIAPALDESELVEHIFFYSRVLAAGFMYKK